jgi:hypothetical protein
METTKNKLTENEKIFFEDLSKFLDVPLYFYGSIQRNDYFPGKSDIDVDIFAENESSIITKMQHFLQVKKSSFKKFVWRLNSNNKLVYGYKIMYINKELNFKTEFSIYNKSVQKDILYEHTNKFILPFYISWLLILLKAIHYNFDIIGKKKFQYLKKKLLTVGIGLPDDDFVVIDPK